MISRIKLSHFVLVEQAEIELSTGFTAITGETGAGKTAFTEAIQLCFGQRADPDLIRKGEDRASVEVHLAPPFPPALGPMLHRAGIDWDGEPLVIRREIAREGKSRAFLHCQSVPLSLLQEVGALLIDIVEPYSAQQLLSPETQREMLDLFSAVDLAPFQTHYAEENKAQEKLLSLRMLRERREKEAPLWQFQLDEIEEAKPLPGEEDTLFTRYRALATHQESQKKLAELQELLPSVLTQLSQAMRRADGALAALLQESTIALKEALYELDKQISALQDNPEEAATVETRLSLLTALRRKYGDPLVAAEELRQKLAPFESVDDEIAAGEGRVQALAAKTQAAASSVSQARRQGAARLSQELTPVLEQLNMTGARVDVRVEPAPRSTTGDERVSFWIQANLGENLGLVQDHASGGELARLLFALKVLLADKNITPTLLFDEIDANVGGTTATRMGAYLCALGKHKQVLCITHFPQVASQADAHLRIEKRSTDGRTLTALTTLTHAARDEELVRMRGQDAP
jgi:DNA repair protein RecN (Recombination protein N)